MENKKIKVLENNVDNLFSIIGNLIESLQNTDNRIEEVYKNIVFLKNN